jgi:ATP-dependent DNA helicase RecG
MNAPTERLRRVLELERARGYPDTAVIGGVDRMLRALLLEGALTPGTAAHEALISLPAHGYKSMSPDARQRWAARVLREVARPVAPRRPISPASEPARASPQPSRSGGAGAGQALGRAGPSRAVPGTASARAVRATKPAVFGASMQAGATTARRPAAAPKRASKPHADGLEASVTALPYVNTATARKLERLGVRTVRDLLWHLPHRYEDFSDIRPVSELTPGVEQTLVGTVWSAAETTVGRFRKATEAVIGDHTGNVRVIWFNQPWLARELHTNDRVALSGKVSVFQGVRQMESPEWEVLEGDITDAVHTGRLLPVYPLTAALSARTLRRLIREAVQTYLPLLDDPLPEEVRTRRGLLPLGEAVSRVHYPADMDDTRAARERLAFDELLTLQLAVLRRRAERDSSGAAPSLHAPDGLIEDFHASLPFALTAAQRRVTGAILADLEGVTPMSRLVQGDVGSGKTVVAAAALLTAAANGYQGALMAPTEILAEQHFRTLCRLLGGESGEDAVCTCEPSFLRRPLRLALLRGGLTARAKSAAQRALAEGSVDIVVGTQALIQEGVTIPRLGLAVVDEQHRFGVAQRAALRGSEGTAHLLVMTATPIPRTLALTLYGDLDVSVIDEMPPGRRPVKTLVVQSHERDAAYSFIIEQLRAGRQAFVICPLVEESEVLEVRAATAEYERLHDVFTSASLALLHGRMPAAKKDEVMRAFRDRLYDVLISTAVVEVGIDVPNATVIMIEGADRFGLAQLHQFRGRVGRGDHQSYCFLMADAVSDEARQRLQLMEAISDGFRLAEEDLRLRGPGEYFGTRQSGLPELKVANLADTRLLEAARAEAGDALAPDPTLASTAFSGFAPAVERILSGAGGHVS